MTVEKTQENLSTVLEKAERALGGIENAIDQDVETIKNGKANSSLPREWVMTLYSEVYLSASNGIGGKQNKDGLGIPVSRIETIAKEFIDYSRVGYLAEYDPGKIIKHKLNNGDILFSHINSALHLGKTALFQQNYDLYHGINLLRIVVNKKLCLPKLFNYHCKFSRELGLFSLNAQHAVNQASINQKKLGTFLFPLPPLAEQTVIAQTLDTLLAQVDNIKTRLDAIPKILKTFRQSVLAAAVSGKLTEEWRGENECELSAWVSSSIGDVAIVATGTTPKRTNLDYWTGGDIPWLTSASTGKAFTSEAEQFVTELAVKEGRLKLFGPGTLLIAMYGEGKTRGQVTELKMTATCNQACAAIIVNEETASKGFIKLRLIENYEETRKVAAGGAQPNLNLGKVREIPISLPSLKEQTQIVLRVEELFAFADQVEQQVKNAQKRVNTLTQSILAKAFRGELTSQWRAENPDLITGDNSAEALLAKIQLEREALKQKTKPKKKTALKKAVNKK